MWPHDPLLGQGTYVWDGDEWPVYWIDPWELQDDPIFRWWYSALDAAVRPGHIKCEICVTT